MKFALFVSLICMTSLVSGCDKVERKIFQGLEQLAEQLNGEKHQTLILENAPRTLDPTGLTLTSTTPMQVLGTDSSVCLVLKRGTGVSAKDQNKIFADAMQGTQVETSLTTKDGKSYSLNSQGQAWRMYGVLKDGEENAACYSTCGTHIPTGSEVAQIKIKATPALKVEGIYWDSTNAFDLIPAPTHKAKPAS